MSDAELRCPKCAAPLPAGATRCERCGAETAAASTTAGIEDWFSGAEPPPFVPAPAETPPPLPPETLQPPPLPPPPADEILLLDEPIEAPPPAPRASEPPEVPVVRPARRATPARYDEPPEALPSRRERRDDPPPRTGELVRPPLPPVRDTAPELPRPRIALAMFVLLVMAAAFACGLSVIIYAIYAGLKASRPGKAEAQPVLVAPGEWGAGQPSPPRTDS